MPSTASSARFPAGPLVSSEWLEANLGDPRLRVLDVRGRHPSSSLPHAKHAEYLEGHIPGAVFVDWEHDFVATEDPVPVQVAGPQEFAQRAGELGVGDGDLVVTYDDYYGIFAARVAWAFRLYGAESRVLDGGWTTWHDEGRVVTDELTARQPARFTSRLRPRLRRTLAEVEQACRDGATLVDARPRHLFLGEEGTANTGHIPARAASPTRSSSTARPGCGPRRRRSPGSPATPGSTPTAHPAELIATCGSGVSATVALMALERIGVHCDGVYDGSFNEWSADAARPVAYGRAA